MGEVWRARDTHLDREVAIKLLLEGVSADPDRLARFEREARVLAALNHPNVATLFGFERDDTGSTPFLVMELVEGETLAERIDRGPVPFSEARRIFIQIAEGIQAAHDQGIVHRDLKPANLKLSSNAQGGPLRVKVLDFGLAKALDSGEGRSPDLSQTPTLTVAATRQGEVMGTVAYMSPEQARGETIDKRTDVWAFGACLFETLAGRPSTRVRQAGRVTCGSNRPPDTVAPVLWLDPRPRRSCRRTCSATGSSSPPRTRVSGRGV
jgi:serine/threonine-protein kinase